MQIEEFALGDSWVHRLDPRAKILVAGAFSVVVAVNQHVLASAMSLMLPLALIASARLSAKRICARLAIVNSFVAFMWLFLPFTVPGHTIYELGPLAVHREGIYAALIITLKSNSIVLMIIAMLGTSPIFTLVHALSHLGIPDKLVHLFFFSFRYIHVIHDEYHRLVNAMKMRGFKPRTDIHTYRSFAYLVGMLLVRSFDRSKRILDAMRCRGFKGKFYIIDHYEMKRSDYALASATVLFLLSLTIAT